ncbi:hypothetical protein F4809DRAFT_653374 [Biscogniauxia mediterranea]|nr:hypothetical protein F4809DRAFT_653374 [Biscogniauxia mediterranea]
MHSADSTQTLAMERTSDSADSAGSRVRASKIWAEARREASADLKAVQWLRAGFCTSPLSYQPTASACLPDGSFNPFEDDYNTWAASTFFQISLGLGNFTFTEAKVIDISWDVIVGRGGQAVMGWTARRVFADYVTTSIEVAPIAYATFFVIFLNDSPSILSTIRLMRDFISSRSLKSKVAMVFMILNMIFILGWPTFAGAMTGYQQRTTYHVDSAPFSGIQSCCSLMNEVSDYAQINGFYGLEETPSILGNELIPGPTLDIEAFYIGIDTTLYGSRGSCQPTLDRYQWVFSFIQSFILAVLFCIRIIGTYIMWLEARFQLPLEGQPEVPRRWKSILALAEAINKELMESGVQIESMTDRLVRREIYKTLKRGAVSFGVPLTRSGYSFRRGLWEWLQREKWWCVALFFSFLAALLGPPTTVCSSVLFAMLMGTTKKSRLLLMATSNVFGWSPSF